MQNLQVYVNCMYSIYSILFYSSLFYPILSHRSIDLSISVCEDRWKRERDLDTETWRVYEETWHMEKYTIYLDNCLQMDIYVVFSSAINNINVCIIYIYMHVYIYIYWCHFNKFNQDQLIYTMMLPTSQVDNNCNLIFNEPSRPILSAWSLTWKS